MLRDYTIELYYPAVQTARALDDDYTGAKELAAWKRRVIDGWEGVRVDHVESSGVPDSPQIGATLDVRVYASLGALNPDDVDVQVVHGRVDSDDELREPEIVSLRLRESYEAGRHRFEGQVELGRNGPFGYTVRILSRNRLLATPAELGLVAWPTLSGEGTPDWHTERAGFAGP
jgi:glycogen phosphorylase